MSILENWGTHGVELASDKKLLGGGVSNRKVDAMPEGRAWGEGVWLESLAAIVKNEVGSKSLGLGIDP